MGVFATKNIKKGELIGVWGGIVYSAEEVESIAVKNSFFSTHTVSVYDGFYLGPISKAKNQVDDAELFNHCCNPNIGIFGQIILVARKNIKKNEELFFDYDTTETSAEGSFICKCGYRKCRSKIDGSAWKNDDFVRTNFDYLSTYIQKRISKKRLARIFGKK